MDTINMNQMAGMQPAGQQRPMTMATRPMVQPVGVEQMREWTRTLQKYKAGKASVERRVVSAEQWWKLRNEQQEDAAGHGTVGFRSVSGWLHNVISSKHADAMDSYPEPKIFARERSDEQEARMLSSIVPVIMEHNDFEETYDEAQWQKLKTGTGIYKIIWDKHRHGGMGDIAIERVNLLNVFWEPGLSDIQRSKLFFHTELMDEDDLKAAYPGIGSEASKSTPFTATKFLYDDNVSTEGKVTVIDVYYRRRTPDGRTILHYCKYAGETVLVSTENDPAMAERGLYDHGKFPYVFDALFPVEGSPCGYGYVDLCRNPQTEIDLLNTAFVKNAMVGAVPRYFTRLDANINEDDFLDLNKPIVRVAGNVDEAAVRQIQHNGLDGAYLSVLENVITELRETSGNTETSTGATPSGITAASAIAALQEASGKTSRDSTRGTYRAYGEIVEIVIELIRQFYSLPRQFRITGQMGEDQFVSYSNAGIQPQPMMMAGQSLGMRSPVFDIRVEAQKKTRYSAMAQNELALQLFGAGLFNPQLSDQAMLTIGMMDFDGKDKLLQSIQRNGTMAQMLQMMQQYSMALAAKYNDKQALMQLQGMAQSMGGGMQQMAAGFGQPQQMDSGSEPAHMERARQQSAGASQPDGQGG